VIEARDLEARARMAIKQLSEEQIHTMSLEEKDRWWLENVYRGDMPQLTPRSAMTGMALGGILSLTNLYVGAKTGWTLGVGITSVILSFALFKVFAKAGLGKEMSLLENNAMQSIATSAGYMTSPLFSSLAAYAMVTGKIVPMHVAFVWVILLALLGVLFAFPMKKRFINDEQHPFPEGMAAGVVMDALHEADEKEGMFKAKLLVYGGLLSGLVELFRSDKIMRVVAGMKALPAYYDQKIYELGMKPSILGTQLKDLTIRFDTSIVFIATGGLMGIRTGVSLLLGGVLNYFLLAPFLIQKGIILPNAHGSIGFKEITLWALWGGVACMTTSSIYAFLAKPKMIIAAFAGMFSTKQKSRDILEHIELPTKLSVMGVPIIGAIVVAFGHYYFEIEWWLGIIAIPLVFVFSLIAANATAITSITPTGALGKLTQLTYGVLAPGKIVTNLMTASITAEVAGNASNLLMDIKPGYMLGGKPRHQAMGHVLGAFAGAAVAIPVWYFFLIDGDISRYGTEQLPVPGALIWKAVSEVLMKGLGFLHPTARWAVVVGAVIGLALEISKQVTKGKFPLSAVGLGLAFVLPFFNTWTMFLGSFAFWLIERQAKRYEATHAPKPRPEEIVLKPAPARRKPWFVLASENMETVCAGVIAGGAILGIGVTILELRIPDVAVLQSIGPVVTNLLAR
jgi:OPT family oligopeptide transporter